MSGPSESALRSAAERTPELGGTRIRTFGTGQAYLTLLVLLLVVVVGALFATRLGLAYAVLLPTLLFFGLWYLHALRVVRANNEGVAALLRADDATAIASFRRVASMYGTRESAAMALHNLGVVALRARNPKSAVDVFRAALAVGGGGFRWTHTPTPADALVRAHLGFALAAVGELDEAKRILDALAGDHVAEHLPMAVAYATRARVYLALKRGAPEEALALLDEERTLLSNVLTGSESMLAEAMRAVACAALEKPVAPAWVDEEGARFVFGFLPEAKEHVVLDGREA
jgi:tetratricopeptide (TPR) repeat protein